MKSDKYALNRAFAEFLATLGDDINLETVFDEFRQYGTGVVQTYRERKNITITRDKNRIAMPVHIDGVDYKNARKASLDLGISPEVVAYRCTSPYFPTWVNDKFPKRKIMKIDGKTKAIPVEIEGIKYSSVTGAAKKLQMSVGSVNFRLHSDLFPEWKFTLTK